MPHEERERIRRLRAEAVRARGEFPPELGSPAMLDSEQPARPDGAVPHATAQPPAVSLRLLVLATLVGLCFMAAVAFFFPAKPLLPDKPVALVPHATQSAFTATIEPVGPILDGIQLPAVARLALEPAWQGTHPLDSSLLKLHAAAAAASSAGLIVRIEDDGTELPVFTFASDALLGADGDGGLAAISRTSGGLFCDGQDSRGKGLQLERRLAPLCNPVVLDQLVFWAGRDRQGRDCFGCSDCTRQRWAHAADRRLLGVQPAGELGIFVTTAADAPEAAQTMLYSPAGKALWKDRLLLRRGTAPAFAPAVAGVSPALLYAIVPSDTEPMGFKLARLDPDSAQLRWQQRIDQPTTAGPYILADGSALLGAGGGKLEVFSASGVPVSALPAKAVRLLPLPPVEHAGSNFALVELAAAYGGQTDRLAVLEIHAGATQRLWLLNTRLAQPDSMVQLGSKLLLGQRGATVEALRWPPSSAPPG